MASICGVSAISGSIIITPRPASSILSIMDRITQVFPEPVTPNSSAARASPASASPDRMRTASDCSPLSENGVRCLRVFRQHAAHLAPEQSLLHQRPQNRCGHAGVLSEGGCGDRFGRVQQDTQHRALGG